MTYHSKYVKFQVFLFFQGNIHACEQGWVPLSQSVGAGRLSAVSLSYLVENQDQAVIWRGPKKTAMIKQFVQDVCWGTLDYLLIDTPPGTDNSCYGIPLIFTRLYDELLLWNVSWLCKVQWFDMFAGTSDEHMAVMECIPNCAVILATSPQVKELLWKLDYQLFDVLLTHYIYRVNEVGLHYI